MTCQCKVGPGKFEGEPVETFIAYELSGHGLMNEFGGCSYDCDVDYDEIDPECPFHHQQWGSTCICKPHRHCGVWEWIEGPFNQIDETLSGEIYRAAIDYGYCRKCIGEVMSMPDLPGVLLEYSDNGFVYGTICGREDLPK